MSEKKINSYEDLEEEKKRLMIRLRSQEVLIRTDLAGLKENLKPIGNAMQMVNKMATRDNSAPAMNFGLEMGIDLIVRKVLLAKAGWFTKIVVPFLVKNYSSHIIGQEKREALVKKIKGFFKKIRPSTTAKSNDITPA